MYVHAVFSRCAAGILSPCCRGLIEQVDVAGILNQPKYILINIHIMVQVSIS